MAVELTDLIALSHSQAAADSYRAYIPTEAHLGVLAETGKDVLVHFPPMPAACAMMSALYAARMQMQSDAPVFVVAGVLSIGSTCVFGNDADTRDWRSAFNESNPSWDGHCWVMLGDYIADISIFRTAYSQHSPPLLAEHVAKHFGTGRGLLICKTAESSGLGFLYQPQCVLTEGQITGLMNGARSLFEQSSRR
jgi:hypothetical protein